MEDLRYCADITAIVSEFYQRCVFCRYAPLLRYRVVGGRATVQIFGLLLFTFGFVKGWPHIRYALGWSLSVQNQPF